MNKENKILIKTTDISGKVIHEEWVRCDEENTIFVQRIPLGNDGYPLISVGEVKELHKKLKEVLPEKTLAVFETPCKVKKLKFDADKHILIQECRGLDKNLAKDTVNYYHKFLVNCINNKKDNEPIIITTLFNIKVMTK